jgi:uncharacterized protein (UPF0548 family)
MFCISKPTEDTISAFIAAQKRQRYSYVEVGASREQAPAGYTVDHNRIQLGQGPDDFERAKKAIRQWKMFDMSWIHLCWTDTPIESNATVAVLIRHLGFWSLNAARIVYVLEEHGKVEKYGFAYGTLPGHSECGEERFTVEYHMGDQSVWYDLYAYSRPGFLATLGYPFARVLQKKFAENSKAAMQITVRSSLK